MPTKRFGEPATIRDVAAELGLSVATVSRALSRPELLRPQTRARVLAVVEALGYRPNLLARGLRRGRSHAILAIVPNLSPFFLEILAGVEEVAREAGFAVLLGNSGGDSARLAACFEQVANVRADGVILLTGSAPAAYARVHAGCRRWSRYGAPARPRGPRDPHRSPGRRPPCDPASH